MKNAYTQPELKAFAAAGRTIVVGFRAAAAITWSHGVGAYVLVPLPQKAVGLPFTQRGRRQALTPADFDALLLN